ncbi:MAG: gamma carbonic anhydrase family protein [Desulfobulbus sp.]|jgi:carbonic anhydrase/acetyltransferase-like protein (isoleucine patch superfamily)
MILPYQQYRPALGSGCWVAPTATLIGDAILEEDVSLWFGVVVRGDVHRIRIGARTNIQDLSLLHITQHEGAERDNQNGHPTLIGSDVTVGHRVILHGCTVGDRCLIGMGAIILDGAVIGDESLVGAGALVTPGKRFPPRSVLMGTPAKVIREVSDDEVRGFLDSARRYAALKDQYRQAGIGDRF